MNNMPTTIWAFTDGTWGDDDDRPITEDEERYRFEYIDINEVSKMVGAAYTRGFGDGRDFVQCAEYRDEVMKKLRGD